MRGHDRRSEAACPCLAAHELRYTPVRVVELELDRPGELRSPGGLSPVVPSGRVSALVRLHGHPLGLVQADGPPGDPAGLRRALVAAAHRDPAIAARRRLDQEQLLTHLPAPTRPLATGQAATPTSATPTSAAPASAAAPTVSVVVATRDRPASLRRCLDSLLRTGYPELEVVVVDNAPSDDASRDLVLTEYPARVRYLREPVPGLARAHNRGLVAVHGTVVAFTDDDTLVDPGWPWALAEAFTADRSVGCVTGLIVPAELETAAQAALEAHGGYAKGFALRRWSLREPPPGDPLFPFTGGQFGSGANMAFRTALLRGLGGFDPATGTGTPARGGDDLLAFFRVLTSGAAITYRPDAIVWHHHRRTPDAVPAQAYGYGVGFGAYLTAAVRHQPTTLPALLRVLPRGVRVALRGTGRCGTRHGSGPEPGPAATRATARHPVMADATVAEALAVADPAELARLQLRGLAYGPFGYLRSALQEHRLRTRAKQVHGTRSRPRAGSPAVRVVGRRVRGPRQ